MRIFDFIVKNYYFLQEMAADGELLLIRISPDQDGKFGFNVKVSVFFYSYLCVYACNDQVCFADCLAHYALLNGCLF